MAHQNLAASSNKKTVVPLENEICNISNSLPTQENDLPPRYPGLELPALTTNYQRIVTHPPNGGAFSSNSDRLRRPNLGVPAPERTHNNSSADNFIIYSNNVCVRNKFLTNVFGLLSMHTIVILGLICACKSSQEQLELYLLSTQWPISAAIGSGLLALLILAGVCISGSHKAARILHGPFVLGLGAAIAFAAEQDTSNIVVYVTATVAAIMLIAFGFVLQSRWDFSVLVGTVISFVPVIAYVILFFVVYPTSALDSESSEYSQSYSGVEPRKDDLMQYLIISYVISFLIYGTVLTMAYQMVHQEPGSPCFINLHRTYDQWVISVMHLYMGVVVVVMCILFSALIILSALVGRFHICFWFRVQNQTNRGSIGVVDGRQNV